jgi:hypothetical protein
LTRPAFSPEISLVIACCRWPASAAGDAAVAVAARAADWDAVLKQAGKHRVEPLVHHALRRAGIGIPDTVEAELARRSSATALHNLAQAAEGARLHQALAGIDHLFAKGTTLGLLAYGGHELKSSCDIDLLVPVGRMEDAAAILASLGYERNFPDPAIPDEQVRRWLGHAKAMLFIHPVSGIGVDIHQALTDNERLLRGVGLGSPRQAVPIGGGMSLPTLAREELYAYLSVHGTRHGWSRLKWLADFSAFAGEDPAELEHLHRAAAALGAGRCSAVGLSLADHLLGKALPASLRAELDADRAVHRIEALACSRIRKLRDVGLMVGAHDTFRLHLSHLRLERSWRHRFGELGRKAVFPHLPSYMAVPGWLRPGYSVLRLILNKRT